MNQIIFVLLWVSILGIAAGYVLRKHLILSKRSREWVSVDAVIIYVESFVDMNEENPRTRYLPKCRYIYNTSSYECVSENTTRSSKLKPGQEISILVNPDEPSWFIFNVKKEKMGNLMILGVIILFALVPMSSFISALG